MAALSPVAIYALNRAVGLAPDRAELFVAIAMAESGGDPSKINSNASTGDRSYGLYQINMIGGLGPERRAKWGLTKNDELLNPWVNARAMADLSQQGANTQPWSVVRTGKYRPHIAAAQRARSVAEKAAADGTAFDAQAQLDINYINRQHVWKDPGALVGLAGAAASAPGDFLAAATPLDELADVLRRATVIFDPGFWRRAGVILLGILLVIAALAFLLRGTLTSAATDIAKGAISK